jgi:broad specificity phosphatase PhoE
MPAASVTILLLRHGQSEWNAIKRWQGTADSPLTSLGRQQALTTARRLATLGRPFGAVWSSDLDRAAETADIIAGTLALGEPSRDTRLREAHAGEWEGLTVDEIEVRFPGWLAEHRRPDRFEPYASVVDRVSAALGDIAARSVNGDEVGNGNGRVPTALVVAHSGVIRSMVRHLGGIDDRIPNLGGVWLKASIIDGCSDLALGDLFDPSGIVVSGVDAPGEDPGD